MATSKLSYLIILLCFFLLHHHHLPVSSTPTTTTNCPISICGNITIRFPFHLHNNKSYGSYSPSFDLVCKHPQNLTILTLPTDSGRYFLVTHINYLTQIIHVIDPRNCLLERLINISFSGSPFTADLQPSNTTLFTCPKNFTRLYSNIDCLGNETRSVVAVPSDLPVDEVITKRCVRMTGSLMLPSGKNLTELERGHDALEFKWHEPRCSSCETNGGMCGMIGDDGDQNRDEGQPLKTGCFFAASYSHTDDSKNTSNTSNSTSRSSSSNKVFKIIAMSVALPALTCTFCICSFLCFLDRRATRYAAQRQAMITTQLQLQPTTVGLDQSTIDSYTKVVLGESLRVPGPSDGTCPICLSDFSVKDTVRCIPECQHCFHADCVDEWLKINSSCPVCRKSPCPSPNQPSIGVDL